MKDTLEVKMGKGVKYFFNDHDLGIQFQAIIKFSSEKTVRVYMIDSIKEKKTFLYKYDRKAKDLKENMVSLPDFFKNKKVGTTSIF